MEYPDGAASTWHRMQHEAVDLRINDTQVLQLKKHQYQRTQLLGIHEGQTLLHARFRDLEATLRIRVYDAQRESMVTIVGIAPDTPTISVGERRQLRVRFSYPAGLRPAQSPDVRWQSSAPNILNVSPTGEIEGQRPGDAMITARIIGQQESASMGIRVHGVALQRIEPMQAQISIPLHAYHPWPKVRAIFADDSEKIIAKGVRVIPSSTSVKVVDYRRRLRGVQEGQSELILRYLGQQTRMLADVRSGMQPERLHCRSEEGLRLLLNEGRGLRCALQYSDGSEQALYSEDVDAHSSDPGIVSLVIDQHYIEVVARREGQAMIEVRAGALSNRWPVTVANPELLQQRLEAPTSMHVGETGRWRIMRMYSNGWELRCWGASGGISSDDSVLQTYSDRGLRAISPGQATLTVSCQGQQHQQRITVLPRSLSDFGKSTAKNRILAKSSPCFC